MQTSGIGNEYAVFALVRACILIRHQPPLTSLLLLLLRCPHPTQTTMTQSYSNKRDLPLLIRSLHKSNGHSTSTTDLSYKELECIPILFLKSHLILGKVQPRAATLRDWSVSDQFKHRLP